MKDEPKIAVVIDCHFADYPHAVVVWARGGTSAVVIDKFAIGEMLRHAIDSGDQSFVKAFLTKAFEAKHRILNGAEDEILVEKEKE